MCRRKIEQPGRSATKSLYEKLGLNDPEIQKEWQRELDKIESAESDLDTDRLGQN